MKIKKWLKVLSFTILMVVLLVPATPAFAGGGPPIVDVTFDIVTVDSRVGGGFWAYDYILRHVQIWEVGENSFYALITDTGTFTSWGSASPNATGTIGAGVTGTMVGGYTMTFVGDFNPSSPVTGYLGTFDYGCDQAGDCSNYLDWRTLFFDEWEKVALPSWGWTYTTCGNGYWINAKDGNSGDITGEPVACESKASLSCPDCGKEEVIEISGETVAIAWFSDTPCNKDNCAAWYKNNIPWAKMWTSVVDDPSITRGEDEPIPWETFIAANGEEYNLLFIRDDQTEGDFSLWGSGGYEDRIRDYLEDPNVNKYKSCSISPGWVDTVLVDGIGYARWTPGHTVSGWRTFILDNEFLLDLEGMDRFNAAEEWAWALKANGDPVVTRGWNGDLSEISLFELPD